jgi:hypothetical protein
MRYRMRVTAVLLIAFGFGEATAGDVDAVVPGVPGVLTKCRSWLVATSCKTYHHISLPPRIAVGDTVSLSFGGSSPKDYAFPVARIDLKAQHCTIFTETAGGGRGTDKISVAACYRAK